MDLIHSEGKLVALNFKSVFCHKQTIYLLNLIIFLVLFCSADTCELARLKCCQSETVSLPLQIQ